MILPTEYLWLESYLNNDSLWFEDALNWEDVFDITLTEFSLYSFISSSFFLNSHFFIDYHSKLSFLDIILFSHSSKILRSREFFDFFIWDFASFIQYKFLSIQFFFYSDFQDFIVLMLYYSPELIIALNDFFTIYWNNSILYYTPAIVFDLFSDSLTHSLNEFLENLFLFFFFIWLIVLSVNVFRINKWTNSLEIYFVRIVNYFYTVSKESRVQFETMIQTFFFFFFIDRWWLLLLMTIKKN